MDQNFKRGKGYANYYCPTCGKPREKQEFPLPEELETIYCLNCETPVAFGYLLSFNAICPKCGQFIKAG